ncbi:hypothetical protein Patl1_00956 [Pistacia atlantica]|uniref:Uncharacterized protein n=1 Tax=Pistacia atlantica TaxID=434234 RepID=A0ACC1CCG8_9ROSI|nr:hypothetical protein Patl1_00956 [Pistacia atlantica]
MCGGAIIADLIPRRGGGRVTASDLWPNSPFATKPKNNFEYFPHAHDYSLKRPQTISFSNNLSKTFGLEFGYDLNQIGGYGVEIADQIVSPVGDNYVSGSGSEFGYDSTEVQNVNDAQVNVKEEEMRKAQEEENEVQKLSEELVAYENFMKFYQIPYLDGQSPMPNSTSVQESVVGDLWSFDDEANAAAPSN